MGEAPRILVVDDEEDARVLLCRLFEDAGYRVDLAGDVSAGIDFLKQAPDLVVLDLVMPNTDGWSLLEHTRKVPNGPILVLTARGDIVSFGRAIGFGVAGYVFKPFRLRSLVATCERILAAYRTLERRTREGAIERRREPRRLFAVEAAAWALGGPMAWCKLVDVSVHGAQVDLPSPLNSGARLRVSVFVPDGEAPVLEMRGRVLWNRKSPWGFSHGVVLEGLEIQAGLRDLIVPAA